MLIVSRGLFPVVALFFALSAAFAQDVPPVPDAATLAARAARRFPQPVRVGDLLGRDVLQPIEAQPVLGHQVAVLDYTPDQLAALPTADIPAAALAPETIIRLGLTKPFH